MAWHGNMHAYSMDICSGHRPICDISTIYCRGIACTAKGTVNEGIFIVILITIIFLYSLIVTMVQMTW